jgi:predicted trehalose synthase
MEARQATVNSLTKAALALDETAKNHKRLVAHHRRELKRSKAALEELRQELARIGIGLVITNGEGETHGR